MAQAPDEATTAEVDDPTLRQRLHAATGDRDAEAKALADQAGEDVSEDDARIAVGQAHGDLETAQPETASDLASPADASVVHDAQSGRS